MNYDIYPRIRPSPRLFRLVCSSILFFIVDQTMTPPEAGKWKGGKPLSLSLFLCSFASPPRLFVQRWNREFVGPEVDHRVSLKLPFSVRLCLVGRGGEGSQLGKYLSALSIPLSNPISHPPFYPRNPLSLHALMCHSALLDN